MVWYGMVWYGMVFGDICWDICMRERVCVCLCVRVYVYAYNVSVLRPSFPYIHTYIHT